MQRVRGWNDKKTDQDAGGKVVGTRKSRSRTTVILYCPRLCIEGTLRHNTRRSLIVELFDSWHLRAGFLNDNVAGGGGMGLSMMLRSARAFRWGSTSSAGLNKCCIHSDIPGHIYCTAKPPPSPETYRF